MEELTSLTKTPDFYADLLLKSSGGTFDSTRDWLWEFEYGHSFLQDVLKYCITILQLSKRITGIGENQESNETWLLDVLREIYKNAPHSLQIKLML